MEIGKAIVLATETTKSGLWPSLGISAPQLTPVASKPILFHHLEALAAAGVRQVAIVAPGSTGAAIREAARDGSSFALDVLHVADGPRAMLSSSAIAAFVGRSPVLLHRGDVLMRERFRTLAALVSSRALDALVLRPASAVTALDGVSGTDYIMGADIHEALCCEAANAGRPPDRRVAG